MNIAANESLTGTIAFDHKGMRKNYELEVHQLELKTNLRKVSVSYIVLSHILVMTNNNEINAIKLVTENNQKSIIACVSLFLM